MIASIDNDNRGYFSIYYLSDINAALDNAGTNDVNIQNINCVKAFVIPNLISDIGSIQGYDIDNGANYIYISSQYSPVSNDSRQTRKIVKIPWGDTNSNDWDFVNLDSNATIDNFSGNYQTEFESMQVIDNNNVWLTVAYHDMNQSNHLTVMNRIYRVSW
ncbi:helveticin J family class III bacteriocin [Lactobacillus helveticus]|nr:helveticin J family class III bacteriocin [Lactobacillus helveticus]